eukprot:6138676-Heterocapsa_arctica.AAC.1
MKQDSRRGPRMGIARNTMIPQTMDGPTLGITLLGARSPEHRSLALTPKCLNIGTLGKPSRTASRLVTNRRHRKTTTGKASGSPATKPCLTNLSRQAPRNL